MSVAVVGGGIIGLSIAWELSRRDVDVVVFDDGDAGAWQVAAGMLALVVYCSNSPCSAAR